MKLSQILRGKLDALVTERDGLLNDMTPEAFTVEVEARANAAADEIDALRARITEVEDQEVREAKAAEVRKVASGATVNEAHPVYRKGDVHGASYFRDLFNAKNGDSEARGRLVSAQETRALTTVAGAGGTFAPPLWLVEDFVALARPGRVTADLVNKQTLPEGVSSVNLPRVVTGTAVAVQATQNTNVQSTDATTDSVSSGITTIAGQQTISLQLISQSGIPFDQVILSDLARAYAASLDSQVIAGSGAAGELTGILTTSGINTHTYTDAAPAVVGAGKFYSQIVQAITPIETLRYLPPTHIVMHPRRWNWVLNALDSQNRPLVVPNGPAFNQLGTSDGAPVAENHVGTLLGIPVCIDPNIPTNLGAGTNEDRVIVMRADDLWLWETALSAASFDATYANQMSVLFRVHAFSAFIANRYPKSISVIAGTGLVAPTF